MTNDNTLSQVCNMDELVKSVSLVKLLLALKRAVLGTSLVL